MTFEQYAYLPTSRIDTFLFDFGISQKFSSPFHWFWIGAAIMNKCTLLWQNAPQFDLGHIIDKGIRFRQGLQHCRTWMPVVDYMTEVEMIRNAKFVWDDLESRSQLKCHGRYDLESFRQDISFFIHSYAYKFCYDQPWRSRVIFGKPNEVFHPTTCAGEDFTLFLAGAKITLTCRGAEYAPRNLENYRADFDAKNVIRRTVTWTCWMSWKFCFFTKRGGVGMGHKTRDSGYCLNGHSVHVFQAIFMGRGVLGF